MLTNGASIVVVVLVVVMVMVVVIVRLFVEMEMHLHRPARGVDHQGQYSQEEQRDARTFQVHSGQSPSKRTCCRCI